MLIVKHIDLEQNINHNLKIVLFSDTHFGNMYSEQNLDNIVEKINLENADIVIFGGDLMDSYYRFPPDTEYISIGLKKIYSKYGKFAVYGNHDYGGGAERVFKQIMDNSDFTVLKNQISVIDDIQLRLIGLDDYLLGNPDKYILSGIEKDYYNIMISHAPDLVDRYNTENINLVFSAHTHGGQVRIPFLTEKVLPPGGQKYIKGFYNFENSDSKLYVTSGIGLTQVNLRFLNTPEIVVFNIHK